jgi:hypothetical protein
MAESKWHKVVGSHDIQNRDGYNTGVFGPVCSCGALYATYPAHKEHCEDTNPTYRIQEIVAALKVLGEERDFITWLASKTWKANDGHLDKMIETIWSDELLIKAATEYLEGVTNE